MTMTVSRAIGRRLAGAGTACVLAAGAGALMAAGSAQAAVKVMPACPAPVISGATATVTCTSTGAAQYWTVPAGVTRATLTLYGAAGGSISQPGGSGAEVTGTLPVTPGSVLQVNAGQADSAFGGGGGGGNGGGGASDIRDGAYRLADRLLVAGGGGGGGINGAGDCGGGEFGGCVAAGGAGGDAGSPGGTAASAGGTCSETLTGAGGGGAGTATMGGAGGAGNTSGAGCGGNTTPPNGGAGSEGRGGAPGEDVAGSGGSAGGSSYTGTATGASITDQPASPPAGGHGEVVVTYPEALTSHQLSGHETSVSCLAGSRCVAVGERGGHGAVVTLRGNGAQSHAAVLRGSSVIDSVSCRQSGCWAIGRPDSGAGAYLVKISSAGRPVAERKLAVPAGTALDAISCSSPDSCEVVGTGNRARPTAIEIGTWNGTRLRLYRVRVTGSTQVSMPGISCWHGDCEAVGHALAGSAGRGLILTTSHGKPGTLHTSSLDLQGVSCISATTCYAAAGVLVTVTDGVATNPQAVSLANLGWSAIECHGGSCEAAGAYAPSSAEESVLVSLTDGTVGSPTYPHVGAGSSGIAARGSSGFIAIGSGNDCTPDACAGTVVTVG